MKHLLLMAISLLLLAGSAKAAAIDCSDCSDCSLKIASASPGDLVQLTQSVSTTGHCIQFGGADNLTFDCQGYTIGGDDSGTDYGIWLNETGDGSNSNTIRNCIVADFAYGVYLNFSSGNNLTGITSSSSTYYGLLLSSNSSSNTLFSITAMYNEDTGLQLDSNSSINTLTNIIASSNYRRGLRLAGSSSNNTLSSITASNNSQYGLWLSYSSGNTLTGIVAMENGLYDVYTTGNSDSYCRNTFSNITGSGNRPIKYFNSSVSLSGETLSELILCDADWSSITNVTIIGSADKKNNGMFVSRTQGSNFTGVNSSYRNNGLYLWSSSNNTVTNLTAASNSQYGILIYYNSDYNNITRSTIRGNANGGIHLDEDAAVDPEYNLIWDNHLNNTLNVQIDSGIANPNYFNISLSCSSGPNIIGGPCIGGNYWTGPAGNYSDFCADSNGDSICDAALALDSNNSDRLPLAADRTPPDVTFIQPTPLNSSQTNSSWILINVSCSEPPGSCMLNWNNGTFSLNESFPPAGALCSINKTALANGTYSFKIYARDSASNWNSTEARQITVSFQAPAAPEEMSIMHSASPRSVQIGNSTRLSINATTNGTLDRIILRITMPNSTLITHVFSANATLDYAPPIAGIYNFTIFANNTNGYSKTVADNFTAASKAIFNSTVMTYNGSGITARIEFYYPGTGEKISDINSSSGIFQGQEILQQDYDILFQPYESAQVLVKLSNVNITQNPNGSMGFDTLPVQGYFATYAVNSTYPISSAAVRIFYAESGIDEDHIGLYKCAHWNFTERMCNGTWESMSFAQDKSQNSVSFGVTSFSAFSLKQEPYCGDFICQAVVEDADACPSDCDCIEGDIIECGMDIGECTKGSITCHSGTWGECEGAVIPQNETCDGKDNDCDGSADEGDLAQQCGTDAGACEFGIQACSGGIWGACTGAIGPSQETCNGIDDDCDGSTDEDGDCCANGETRQCGTSLTQGNCHPGTSTCVSSVWSECTDSVGPSAEVCNDNLDNDCDGLTDSSDSAECAGSTCGNGVQDANETGVDCGGSCSPCPDYTTLWISLSAAGAVILGVLLFLYFKLRRQGRELTWEEVMKNWSPGQK